MMKWVIAAGLVLAAPFAASAQDAEAGKAVFKKCSACHAFGKNALGPNLTCVSGRAAGTVEGYAGYSDAVKKSGVTWDDEKLLAWFEKDDAVIPGNKMIFPAGVKDATDRANLLAYIKSECKQ
jgi:cytochrome c